MGKVVQKDFFKNNSDEQFQSKPEQAGKPTAPVDKKPAPAEKKPAPAEKKPAPAEKTPAPAEKKPAPAEKKPAPAEKKPAPADKKPAPAEKKPAPTENKPAPTGKPTAVPIAKTRISPMRISENVMNALKQTSKVLTACGRGKAAKEIDGIYLRGTRNMFTVAVVGEFSRGKSTFINGLLGKDILPVGDLPTTAMLTHIKYNSKESMIHIDTSGNMISLPPAQESWEGLTADNFGKHDPEGTVHIGLKQRWLGENNVEIMDTPGAGDLEQRRAQLIGEALLGSDGAIITVSAASPLSLTEKTFIEERLLTRKTPFLMLVITKLDTIRKKERASVVEYIKKKLKSWKMDIPVFIPKQVEFEDNTYDSIMGYDKIRAQILAWINDAQRVKLTEAWISAQATLVIERELAALKEQEELLGVSDEKKRAELIEAKKASLKNAEKIWDNLCEEMKNRGNLCFEKIYEHIQNSTVQITERLQFEAGHTNAPEKWYKEDLPYRLKIELTNMSVGVTNLMTRIVTEDTRWLNAAFEQNFKSRMMAGVQDIAAEKFQDQNLMSTDNVKFADIDKQRKKVKIASTILTIVGASASMALRMSSLVWTMGVGTGVSLISDSIFKKELEDQRKVIIDKIAESVPLVVDESISRTQDKIDFIYNDILRTAGEKKQEWLSAQTAAIESSVKPQSSAEHETVLKQIAGLEKLIEKLT